MDAFIVLDGPSSEILIGRYYKNGANEQWARAVAAALREKDENVQQEFVVALEDRAHVIICRNDLYLVAITKQEYPVLLLTETLEQVLANLTLRVAAEDGTFNEATVKEHYGMVVTLIDEMLDFGLAGMLEPNALALLVPPKPGGVGSALQRISPSRIITDIVQSINGPASENAAEMTTADVLGTSWVAENPGHWMGSGSGVGMGSGIIGCGSALWWRRGGVSHSSNEIHVNLLETLHCIVNTQASDRILDAYVSGSVELKCQLTGIPNCRLVFKNPQVLGSSPLISFHPCVQLQKWKQEQVVAFVPPDGSFVPFQYSLTNPALVPPVRVSARFSFPDAISQATDTPSSASHFGKFEIALEPQRNFGTLSGGIGSHENLVLQNVKLTILLPDWVTGLTSIEPTSGTVKFVSKRHSLMWSFSRFPLDVRRNNTVKCDGTLTLNPAALGCYTGGALRHDAAQGESNETLSSQSTSRKSNRPAPCLHPKDFRPIARLQFWINNWAVSGISIDSIEVSGTTTPVKNFRSSTEGIVEYRL